MPYREFEPRSLSSDLSPGSVLEFFRIAGAILGLVVILLGCLLAVTMFSTLYSGVMNPEEHRELVATWSEVVGGEETTIRINDVDHPIAKPLAIIVLGGGAFLLIWITMGMMLTGAKMVAWTAGESAAVKRLLKQGFRQSASQDRPAT